MAVSDESRPRLSKPEVNSPRKSLRWLWGNLIVLLVVGLTFSFFKEHSSKSAKNRDASEDGADSSHNLDRKGALGMMNRVMPVGTAKATLGNIHLFDENPGNVTPLATVTVKSRVDGELLKVVFQEGQIVQQGEVLAEIDPRPYQAALLQTKGQLIKDTAALTNSQLDLARSADLLKAKATTQQAYDTQAALVRQNEGTVEADQGAVQNAQLQFTYTHITAPVTGRVGLRLVDAGNIVHASDTGGLVVITQLQPISIIFTIEEDRMPAVQKQIAEGKQLTVEAFDRTFTNKLASGSLLTLDNQIDSATGTVKLKALFPNDDQQLFPNQFVNVRLLVETKANLVLVPTAAIQQGPQSAKFVYVVQPDQTVTVQNVTLGPAEGDFTSIVEGLAAGQVVVIDGADKLRDGAKVQLSAPARAGKADQGATLQPGSSPHHRRQS